MWILLVNLSAIVLGTIIGCLLRKYISRDLQDNSMVYFAIVTAVLSIRLIDRIDNFSAVVTAFLLGGVVGHILKIDRRLQSLSGKIPAKENNNNALLLVAAFTAFCISTSGILGAMDLAFSGSKELLITKAIMDALAAVFFAAGCGWSLLAITLPLAMVLFGFYGLAGVLMPIMTPALIGDFSGCGGMILLLSTLRLAKIKEVPVTDLIPALALVIPISYLWNMYL
ncbi:MAG: DUF554 domain-containing protein [Peptococcaceae bacterium]|jgi:uncharacterized membrane protein YqgA involved in biofilm formation|nr:DUF554 domain-containing protein [Peptococcaceae bacterium]